jgi:hypothetical protein
MKTKPSFAAALGAAVLLGAIAKQAASVEDDDLRFDTTDDLYNVCAVPADAPEHPLTHQACRAFIEAAVQYHDAVSDKKHLKRLICYPESATIRDGKEAFLAWARKNAGNKKLMGEMPVIGLVRSLEGKYPCKR